MLIIGMTGGIGSGKSEASKIFASLNIEVIDLDKISRELTEKDHEAIEEIKTLLGQSLFNKENELDRKKLRDMIFSDKNLKIKLENILHPKILAEVKKKLSIFSDEPYVVIDIPLLFETNQYVPLITRTLVIDCELSNQIERARKRDGMEIAMVQSIISQQVDRNTRTQRGDDVILNDGSIESLEDSIKKLHEKYLNLVAVK
jgi:dephospho-CoA kinase